MTHHDAARAIIIDDQPFMALVSSDVLREIGFEPLHASDPAEGLRLLEEHPNARLVVTEAELAGGAGGVELARRLSQQRPDLPVVVLTAGEVPPGLPERARVLKKPYASEDLHTLVTGAARLEDA
jgi:CheY-like chemotaxis protein